MSDEAHELTKKGTVKKRGHGRVNMEKHFWRCSCGREFMTRAEADTAERATCPEEKKERYGR
jgi:hypothetical protein